MFNLVVNLVVLLSLGLVALSLAVAFLLALALAVVASSGLASSGRVTCLARPGRIKRAGPARSREELS